MGTFRRAIESFANGFDHGTADDHATLIWEAMHGHPHHPVHRSYDAWIDATQVDPLRRDRIVDGDITVVNTTMAARTSHEAWAPVIAADDWSWLVALDHAWDLFEMPDEDWAGAQVADLLRVAFAAVQRRGLQITVITKVLHIKRPNLIPVLDSLVIGQVGGRSSEDVRVWVAIIEHIRRVGLANLPGLRAIRAHLLAAGLQERSLVRILDSLLWTCTPGSALFDHLGGWERVFRPVHRVDD